MRQVNLDKITVYIPKRLRDEHLIEKLIEIAEKEERSVNYLATRAIREYIDRAGLPY